MSVTPSLRKDLPWLRIVTMLLIAADLLWVLSLPAWPSQDGPVHLYYVHVLKDLLHGGSAYGLFFRIKHFAPPYALYYYVLLMLGNFMPLLLADRVVICAYIVLFITGFHALAKAVARENPQGVDRSTLLATLLVLNWPLGMGFVNYMLSLALALWALAVWIEPHARSRYRRAQFVVLVGLVTLAHAVPLLVVLGVAGLELLTRRWREPAARRGQAKDWLTLGLASLSLLYVWAFANHSPFTQRTMVHVSRGRRALQISAGYLQSRNVTILFGHTASVVVYRLAVGVLLGVALLLAGAAAAQQLQRKQFTSVQLFFAVALLLLLALPWLPSDVSGAYFFTERLLLLPWIFALVAAAGFKFSETRAGSPGAFHSWFDPLTVLFSVGANACLLVAANSTLRPVAQQAREVERSGVLQPGDRVLLLESEVLPQSPPITASWNPYFWMPVHALRARDAVLVNAPWLDSSIIPLGAMPRLAAQELDPQSANTPQLLGVELRHDAALAAALLPHVSVVWFGRAQQVGAGAAEPWMQQPGERWRCAMVSSVESKLCRSLQPSRDDGQN